MRRKLRCQPGSPGSVLLAHSGRAEVKALSIIQQVECSICTDTSSKKLYRTPGVGYGLSVSSWVTRKLGPQCWYESWAFKRQSLVAGPPSEKKNVVFPGPGWVPVRVSYYQRASGIPISTPV